MAELVVAAYLGIAPMADLEGGVLDFNRTCIGVLDPRGYPRYPGQALQLLTLLLPDTQTRSDEGIIHRMFEVGPIQLSEKDTDAVKSLLEATGDEAGYVQHRALQLLGEVKSPQAVPALLEKLQQDPTMVGETALALAQIGDSRAVQPLIAALNAITPTDKALERISSRMD
jgi:hypothetical protein